jgi:hypothetical protein
MAERETANKVDKLIESLKLADQYEEEDYDNWALAVRLSVGEEVAKLPKNDKELFITRVRTSQQYGN